MLTEEDKNYVLETWRNEYFPTAAMNKEFITRAYNSIGSKIIKPKIEKSVTYKEPVHEIEAEDKIEILKNLLKIPGVTLTSGDYEFEEGDIDKWLVTARDDDGVIRKEDECDYSIESENIFVESKDMPLPSCLSDGTGDGAVLFEVDSTVYIGYSRDEETFSIRKVLFCGCRAFKGSDAIYLPDNIEVTFENIKAIYEIVVGCLVECFELYKNEIEMIWAKKEKNLNFIQKCSEELVFSKIRAQKLFEPQEYRLDMECHIDAIKIKLLRMDSSQSYHGYWGHMTYINEYVYPDPEYSSLENFGEKVLENLKNYFAKPCHVNTVTFIYKDGELIEREKYKLEIDHNIGKSTLIDFYDDDDYPI